MYFFATQVLSCIVTRCILCTAGLNITMDGWHHWTHDIVSSLNLFCPHVCKTLTDDLVPVFFNCCFRQAKPYWRISPWDSNVGSLSVEYRNRNGIAEIIDENQSNFQIRGCVKAVSRRFVSYSCSPL